MFGVFRVTKSGKEVYLPCSATHSQKLAQEIADERSRGEITLPTGQVTSTKPFPHIAKAIGTSSCSLPTHGIEQEQL